MGTDIRLLIGPPLLRALPAPARAAERTAARGSGLAASEVDDDAGVIRRPAGMSSIREVAAKVCAPMLSRIG
jgi:hypothetical protein